MSGGFLLVVAAPPGRPAALYCRRSRNVKKTSLAFAGAAFLICLVPAGQGRAIDFFVDNVGGDDRFDGSGPSSRGDGIGPFQTIGRALRRAGKGDRIHLANTVQPYRESITLESGRHSGVAGQPFEIVGNGATLEGLEPVPPRVWRHVGEGVFRFQPLLTSHQMLFLDGKLADRVPAEAGQPQRPPLAERQWCLCSRHLYFRPAEGKLPADYALAFTALPVGITLYEVRNVLIRDLIVQGFQLDGINAHDGAYQVAIRNVTCRGNGRSGISIGGASQVEIDGCLIAANGTAQVRAEGFSHTKITRSQLPDITAPALLRLGGKVQWDAPPAAKQAASPAPRDHPPTAASATLR